MRDGEKDRLEFVIRFLEEAIGRRLTDDERRDVEQRQPDFEQLFSEPRDRIDPMVRARKTLAFMRKLRTRQGTIAPDFDLLYKKKADLDHKLLRRDLPDDPSR